MSMAERIELRGPGLREDQKRSQIGPTEKVAPLASPQDRFCGDVPRLGSSCKHNV